MGILSRLFGRKAESKNPEPSKAQPAAVEGGILLHDAHGREVSVAPEQWRDHVLKPQLASSSQDPDALAAWIADALRDGLVDDVVDAARQLHAIDTQPARGACLWGIVLIEKGRVEEAESVLQSFTEVHGDDAAVLVNLARIASKREDQAGADAFISRALAADPNFEQGLAWTIARVRETEGDGGVPGVLRRVAATPGAWRARSWLASDLLAAGDTSAALALFAEALEEARPAPPDLLADVSGSLGQAGLLDDLVRLVAPRFDARSHGLHAGNNLVKAFVDLGRLDDARGILEALHGERRPDWKDALAFWDAEIAKARIAASQPSGDATPSLKRLRIDGPAWLPEASPARRALSLGNAADMPAIVIVGSTVSQPEAESEEMKLQMASEAGRMSRALPLLLAEEIELRLSASTTLIVPFVVAPTRGFVVSRATFPDTQAASMAREACARARHVVIVHVDARGERWALQARVVDIASGSAAGMIEEFLGGDSSPSVVSDLAGRLVSMLASIAGLAPRACPKSLEAPPAEELPHYMLRLEQLLAARCGVMSGADANFLSGVREIVDGQLALCLELPDSSRARLVLVETLRALKGTHDVVLAEFSDRVALLQRDHPLPGPLGDIVMNMQRDILGR